MDDKVGHVAADRKGDVWKTDADEEGDKSGQPITDDEHTDELICPRRKSYTHTHWGGNTSTGQCG